LASAPTCVVLVCVWAGVIIFCYYLLFVWPLFLLFVWWSLNMFWRLCVVFVYANVVSLLGCVMCVTLCRVLLCSVAIFCHIFMLEMCVFVIFAYVYWVKYLFLGDVCCAGCVSDVYCVGVWVFVSIYECVCFVLYLCFKCVCCV